ncbi:CUB and sushi domain-containing protein 2 [Caerostris darwini]|uniref:CUB and sushi domain-containing protein 2 n=1 Tax=Caerostris darwini TaxID=1538125 RepID=A0AAV4W704_9ARAC|nr:CUB and sushi domain-containing protein 2 [Caerostris darwini]
MIKKNTIFITARSCGDPGLVSHAQRLGFVFTFPNNVSYECDDGYKLRGFGSRYCQANGTWSGSLPTCEAVFCNPPSDPKNGTVSYSSLKFGSELRYECEPGFNLKDGEGRICSENGTWIGEEPICEGKNVKEFSFMIFLQI